MKRKDSLFRLIKSLSKSEKRFFKIYSSRHVIGNQNNYVQLFDAIDHQRVYQEEAILKKFKGEKFVKRLAVAKTYLYDLILKSMNVYHAQNSIEAQLRELLGNIAFLHDKRLLNQAQNQVLKAQKLALDYEKRALLPEIIRWQKKIAEAQLFSDFNMENIHQLFENEQNILQELQSINDYWLLQARLYFHQNRKGAITNPSDLAKISEVLQSPLLQTEKEGMPLESQLLRYKTYSTYYFMIRDFANCYDYSKKLIELLESRPELLQLDSMQYVTSINNLLNMSSMLGKEAERSSYLLKLEEMIQHKKWKKPESLQIKLFEAYYYQSILHCISEETYQEGLPLLQKVEEGLRKFKGKVNKIGEEMLCFYSFHIAFGAKAYPKARKWLEKSTQNPAENLREDIYTFSKILTLLVAYELREQDAVYLRKTIRSVYAFLYRKERMYQFETCVLQFLRKLTAIQTHEELKRHFQALLLQLDELAEDNFERKAFGYFDFRAWLQGIES